jgi:hypothetical protein
MTAASGGGLAGVPRFRARGLDFECSLHREVSRATGMTSRAAREVAATTHGAAAKLRRACAVDSERRDVNKRLEKPPHLLARLLDSSSTVERQRRTAAAARLGFRRSATQEKAAVRVWAQDPRGCGTAQIGREASLACGPHTGRRARGGGSDSALSPTGTRRRVGDDRWSPRVIGCGRGRGGADWRRPCGPAGPC